MWDSVSRNIILSQLSNLEVQREDNKELLKDYWISNNLLKSELNYNKLLYKEVYENFLNIKSTLLNFNKSNDKFNNIVNLYSSQIDLMKS